MKSVISRSFTSLLCLLLTLNGCGTNVASPPLSKTEPFPSVYGREDGTVDPEMGLVLNELFRLKPLPLEDLPPDEARIQPTIADAVLRLIRRNNVNTASLGGLVVDESYAKTENRKIKIKTYTPHGKGPFPVIVYAHAGAFVISDPVTYDFSARSLALNAQAVVVAVDYRQGPEDPFPAAHEDVYAVLQWLFQSASTLKGNPDMIAVAGEEAGGNIAAAVCLMAKDRGGKMPVHQLLISPITNFNFDTPPYTKNDFVAQSDKAMLAWALQHYAHSPGDRTNKYLSPMLASNEELIGLPSATILTAGKGTLQQDGELFSSKLQQSGVQVFYRNYDRLRQGFFGTGLLVQKAFEAEHLAGQQLRVAFLMGVPLRTN